jgi:FixJ family two-component response regulator
VPPARAIEDVFSLGLERAECELLSGHFELAREIRQLRPEISIILMSGYSGTQLTERAQAAGVIDVLRKPLIRRDIAGPVARALQARN